MGQQTLTPSEQALAHGSKKAILATGISETSFQTHFTVLGRAQLVMVGYKRGCEHRSLQGASINVRFLLGIQQTGNFRFFLNVEALP